MDRWYNNQIDQVFETKMTLLQKNAVFSTLFHICHSSVFMKPLLWNHGHRMRIHRESDGKGNTADTLLISYRYSWFSY
jgi:hypothetical protein